MTEDDYPTSQGPQGWIYNAPNTTYGFSETGSGIIEIIERDTNGNVQVLGPNFQYNHPPPDSIILIR